MSSVTADLYIRETVSANLRIRGLTLGSSSRPDTFTADSTTPDESPEKGSLRVFTRGGS